MCDEKNVLVKNMFANRLQMGFAATSMNLKDSPWSRITRTLPLNKKILDTSISKEGHADCLFGYKKDFIAVDFLEKIQLLTMLSYCKLLWQKFTSFIEWPSYIVVIFGLAASPYYIWGEIVHGTIIIIIIKSCR